MYLRVLFVDVLLVSLLVGTMVSLWLGLHPGDLSPGAYVEQQQHLIHALNTPMPLLGAVCILLTTVLAVLHRGKRLACSLLVGTVVCLVVAGVITRVVNQPINSQVMTWSIP